MLILKKELVPLYGGRAKSGFLHVAIVDEKGYAKMIAEIDKHDSVSNTEDVWPPFKSFAGLAYHRETKKGTCDWWMIFPISKKGQKIDIETIAHESLHISRMILTDRGVLFDPNNDEPYAYMVGRIAHMTYTMIPKRYLKL